MAANKPRGIAWKLIVSLSILHVATVAVASLVMDRAVAGATYEDFCENMDTQVAALDRSITRYLSAHEALLLTLSRLPLISSSHETLSSYVEAKGAAEIPMDPEKAGGYEHSVFDAFRFYKEGYPLVGELFLGLATNGGYVQYPALARKPGYDPRARGWYTAALRRPDEVVYSDVHVSAAGEPALSAIKVVKDDSGAVRGVVGMDLSLDELTEIPRQTVIGKKGYLIIVDRTGTVISNSRSPATVGRHVAEMGIAEIKDVAVAAHTPFSFRGKDGTLYNSRVYPSSSRKLGWRYVAVVDGGEFQRTHRRIQNAMLPIALGAVLLGLVAIVLVPRVVLR